MLKAYCEVQIIDGIETITNIVLASEEVAKERGYKEISNAEIGMQKIEGEFFAPEKSQAKPSESRMDRLITALLENKLISKEQAKGI